MKRWICFGAAAVLALALCVVFGKILTAYYQPMEDASYDLSLGWLAEAKPEDWVYDQKGWTVFTQEGETVTELEADGNGGFYGLDEPGQTFYFSRVIEEDLDSPTLRLETANRTFSVFLDGALIYTDCPELDNRIGYLRLPSLEWDRTEALLVNLPLDCKGKTLTIAQSTPPAFETASPTVYPCNMTLYCGYAYESALISESFQAAIPAALAYAAGLALLVLFLWQAFQGQLDPGTLCGALTAFSYLTSHIIPTSFTYQYFGYPPIDIGMLCQNLALLALLVMLLCKLSGWRRAILGAATAGLSVMVVLRDLIQATQGSAIISLVLWFCRLGVAGLLLALAFGFLEWNRRRWFFRLFCPLALAGTVFYAVPTVVLINPSYWTFAMLQPLTLVFMLAAFLSAAVEWGRGEVARRTEARLLVQRSELAKSSYEAMRRQHDEVMMLRHDMMKHFVFLRQTTGDEKTAEYLDELIGQTEKIRPVVQSGNEIINVILNSKLSAAVDAGIAVEIVRMQVPGKLALSDAELCSLLVNVLDNALEAAAAPGVERPYIKLDLCVKNHFFFLCCENSATMEHIQKESAPGHGLGIKIIKQIVARYDNLLETEYGADYYSVKLAIPLD